MIAKLVVWSQDRSSALVKLRQALRHYNVSMQDIVFHWSWSSCFNSGTGNLWYVWVCHYV